MVEKERPRRPETTALVAVEAIIREGIPLVIVGGAALALHGIPRSTLDIDIVIPARQGILPQLLKALEDVGLHSQQKGITRLADKPGFLIGQWVSFNDSEGQETLDVFFEEPEAFARLLSQSLKRRGPLVTYQVASLDDLEKMKRSSGRPIDLADIALIEEKRATDK
jgi:hypothetical protein